MKLRTSYIFLFSCHHYNDIRKNIFTEINIRYQHFNDLDNNSKILFFLTALILLSVGQLLLIWFNVNTTINVNLIIKMNTVMLYSSIKTVMPCINMGILNKQLLLLLLCLRFWLASIINGRSVSIKIFDPSQGKLKKG